VTPWPGLYVVGLPLLRRRRSTYIDGAGEDAADIVAMLAAHLGMTVQRRTAS
jgi:putative flavoprotein involved in K+ transport